MLKKTPVGVLHNTLYRPKHIAIALYSSTIKRQLGKESIYSRHENEHTIITDHILNIQLFNSMESWCEIGNEGN